MSLSPGAQTTFDTLRENGPLTKQQIIEKTQFSERSVRNYLDQLFDRNLVKELPYYGKTKLYACIDYVPVLDESRPLAQRWQLFSASSNHRFTVGELATYYGNGVPASSIQAAEYLLKAPALICYYAQDNERDDDKLEAELNQLKEVLKEACDQLQSAIGVLNQLITDPRYWRADLLKMFAVSPDFPLPREIPLIIQRLTEEMENQDDSAG